MKKKNYLIFILIPFLFSSCWILDEKAEERDNEAEISGIIINKYRDSSFNGRNSPILTIVNVDDTVEFDVFKWCTVFFWEYVEIGDSLSKPSGTLSLAVFKPIGEAKLFKYYSTSESRKKKRLFFRY